MKTIIAITALFTLSFLSLAIPNIESNLAKSEIMDLSAKINKAAALYKNKPRARSVKSPIDRKIPTPVQFSQIIDLDAEFDSPNQ